MQILRDIVAAGAGAEHQYFFAAPVRAVGEGEKQDRQGEEAWAGFNEARELTGLNPKALKDLVAGQKVSTRQTPQGKSVYLKADLARVKKEK